MADELARVYTDVDGNVVEDGSADAAYQLTGKDAEAALRKQARTAEQAESAGDGEAKAQQSAANKAVKPSENKAG